MDNYRYIRQWIDDLPKRGLSSFSLDDAKLQFPNMPAVNIRNALHRLSAAGNVRSVWRGFYAIVLPEYGLEGSVPPVEYIDQLMIYVGSDYYVALLSAASYQGASHQSPQAFQVMSNKQLRPKEASGSRLGFTYKKNLPQSGIEKKVVRSGCVNVSVPALTALDLVHYSAKSGGISHVASVLAEFAGSIDFSAFDADLLKKEPGATIQRLGYLLENSLGEVELAAALYEKSAEARLRFNRADLITGQPGNKSKPAYNNKWKIVINYDVEVSD
ncbi:MAG: type IV toxin-antitoxin system AbiEi family antitoxin [Coriobacteriia bacterium]|nr:type IV toxin-antitoxin system AbiEi family antitoxin [Coriobacteriia bacterium]